MELSTPFPTSKYVNDFPYDNLNCLFVSDDDINDVEDVIFENGEPVSSTYCWGIDDIALMSDMCRVDPYFSDCFADEDERLVNAPIDPAEFVQHIWERDAQLAHTFWGVKSHLRSVGVEASEDEAILFVKRAVSEAIRRDDAFLSDFDHLCRK